jgi:hypothetical protein
MYWLEGDENLNGIFSLLQFRPTILTITIRYSDWWFWEFNEPLRMDERWLKCFRGSPGLKELRIEYETLNWRKEEMMKIVRRNKSWKLPLRREGAVPDEYDGHLSAETTALTEWNWKGPSKLDGQSWNHHGPGETVEYVVVTDTWKFVEGPMSEEDMARRPVFTHSDSDFQHGFASEGSDDGDNDDEEVDYDSAWSGLDDEEDTMDWREDGAELETEAVEAGIGTPI